MKLRGTADWDYNPELAARTWLFLRREATVIKKKVLHVGCGPPNPKKLFHKFRGDEWQEVRLDINPAMNPDIVSDMTDMSQAPSNCFDAVWSSHNLEHLYAHQVVLALNEFYRVLAPGGFVLITLPDIQSVAQEVAKGNLDTPLYRSPAGPISAIDILWGLRTAISDGNEFMAHKTGFTGESLKTSLLDASFTQPIIERENYNLWAFAVKPEEPAPYAGQACG